VHVQASFLQRGTICWQLDRNLFHVYVAAKEQMGMLPFCMPTKGDLFFLFWQRFFAPQPLFISSATSYKQFT